MNKSLVEACSYVAHRHNKTGAVALHQHWNADVGIAILYILLNFRSNFLCGNNNKMVLQNDVCIAMPYHFGIVKMDRYNNLISFVPFFSHGFASFK